MKIDVVSICFPLRTGGVSGEERPRFDIAALSDDRLLSAPDIVAPPLLAYQLPNAQHMASTRPMANRAL